MQQCVIRSVFYFTLGKELVGIVSNDTYNTRKLKIFLSKCYSGVKKCSLYLRFQSRGYRDMLGS